MGGKITDAAVALVDCQNGGILHILVDAQFDLGKGFQREEGEQIIAKADDRLGEDQAHSFPRHPKQPANAHGWRHQSSIICRACSASIRLPRGMITSRYSFSKMNARTYKMGSVLCRWCAASCYSLNYSVSPGIWKGCFFS